MTRFRLFKAIAAALLTLAVIGPTGVSAAVPTLTPSWDVVPDTVRNGDYVAFRATITNDDTSTVSQLYLVELARDAGFGAPTSVTPSQGSCNTTGATFVCTLGQLKPHKTAKVTAVFLAPASPATSATERWEFNTTGLGSGGGDNSHGDSWASRDGSGNELLVAALSASGDFGGRYVLNSSLNIVENSQALSNANPHSTRAYSPATGIGVTVQDVDCTVLTPDPICADFTTGFGQISKVNVNDGNDISGTAGTTLLHFYIQLDSSEIPSGANANNIQIEHVYSGGSETISTRCTFAKKATTPNNAPCISVKNLSGGDLGIDIWSYHNGGFKPGLQ